MQYGIEVASFTANISPSKLCLLAVEKWRLLLVSLEQPEPCSCSVSFINLIIGLSFTVPGNVYRDIAAFRVVLAREQRSWLILCCELIFILPETENRAFLCGCLIWTRNLDHCFAATKRLRWTKWKAKQFYLCRCNSIFLPL